MKKPIVNGTVHKLDEPKGSPDEYARINSINPDGAVWVVNFNMPYLGTISKIYSKEEFEKTFEVV